MNILFLDDSPIRTKEFKSNNPSAICVETAKDAIKELDSNIEWSYVYLDHDLGGEKFVDSQNTNTGMEVVRWIVANKPNIDLIIIHSLNPVAANNMLTDLKRAAYPTMVRPFAWKDSV
jgi:hypothetical protein